MLKVGDSTVLLDRLFHNLIVRGVIYKSKGKSQFWSVAAKIIDRDLVFGLLLELNSFYYRCKLVYAPFYTL